MVRFTELKIIGEYIEGYAEDVDLNVKRYIRLHTTKEEYEISDGPAEGSGWIIKAFWPLQKIYKKKKGKLNSTEVIAWY